MDDMSQPNPHNSQTVPALHREWPAAFGLYLPEFEHDACGVGFVAHLKGKPSRQIIDDADRMLRHMDHRGACGCEENTGDGSGMMTGIPDTFLRKVADRDLGIELPKLGLYAVGNVFLPTDDEQRTFCKEVVNEIIAKQGQKLLGWREVPTSAEAADIGPTARAAEPVVEQLFIAAAPGLTQDQFERQLFVIRKWASRHLRTESEISQALMFYICTLSTKVLVYKGMLTASQVMR
jgi:glutamate synthase (NADPH) large chain